MRAAGRRSACFSAGGLADLILYCRNKIYPLGCPTASAACHRACRAVFHVLGIRNRFLPPKPHPVRVSLVREGQFHGYSVIIVTTLERMLLATALIYSRPDEVHGGGTGRPR